MTKDTISMHCQDCGEYDRPRTRSAVSEDGQWLVSLTRSGLWSIHRWKPYQWEPQSPLLADTGQSADEVLAKHLNDLELAEVEQQEREYPGMA